MFGVVGEAVTPGRTKKLHKALPIYIAQRLQFYGYSVHVLCTMQLRFRAVIDYDQCYIVPGYVFFSGFAEASNSEQSPAQPCHFVCQ